MNRCRRCSAATPCLCFRCAVELRSTPTPGVTEGERFAAVLISMARKAFSSDADADEMLDAAAASAGVSRRVFLAMVERQWLHNGGNNESPDN